MTIARLGLVALLVVGCGHLAPTGGLPEASTTTTAGVPSGGPSPSRGVDASRVPASGAVPDGFPSYPNATGVIPGAGELAAWVSDDPPPEVYRHFVESLPAAGFSLDLEAPGGAASIIRFSAPDGSAFQLNLTGSGPIRIALGPVRP